MQLDDLSDKLCNSLSLFTFLNISETPTGDVEENSTTPNCDPRTGTSISVQGNCKKSN